MHQALPHAAVRSVVKVQVVCYSGVEMLVARRLCMGTEGTKI